MIPAVRSVVSRSGLTWRGSPRTVAVAVVVSWLLGAEPWLVAWARAWSEVAPELPDPKTVWA
jgi:hypothetical protein